MSRLHSLLRSLPAVLLLVASPLPLARADIIYSGDIDPADPTTWTSSTSAYLGRSGVGSVEVNGGSGLSSLYGRIGEISGSTGVVTIDGAGSTWSNSDTLYVGYGGSGTLIVSGGATASSSGGQIGAASGSTGVVTIDGTASTWNSGNILLSARLEMEA